MHHPPPLPHPRPLCSQIDEEIESGYYFLTEAQKRGQAAEEKEKAVAAAAQAKAAGRALDFVPPKVLLPHTPHTPHLTPQTRLHFAIAPCDSRLSPPPPSPPPHRVSCQEKKRAVDSVVATPQPGKSIKELASKFSGGKGSLPPSAVKFSLNGSVAEADEGHASAQKSHKVHKEGKKHKRREEGEGEGEGEGEAAGEGEGVPKDHKKHKKGRKDKRRDGARGGDHEEED